MKRIHIALSVADIAASVSDYTRRLGENPVVVIDGEYALWRTPHVNLSIRRDGSTAGTLRHLGWEDDAATSFTAEADSNGILWERFSSANQDAEIEEIWPGSISAVPGSSKP